MLWHLRSSLSHDGFIRILIWVPPHQHCATGASRPYQAPSTPLTSCREGQDWQLFYRARCECPVAPTIAEYFKLTRSNWARLIVIFFIPCPPWPHFLPRTSHLRGTVIPHVFGGLPLVWRTCLMCVETIVAIFQSQEKKRRFPEPSYFSMKIGRIQLWCR